MGYEGKLSDIIAFGGNVKLSRQQEISFKKIYDKATEDIFDMSYVSILIKKLKKKKWGMFTLC